MYILYYKMSFRSKYLKYKIKYLNLKEKIGGNRLLQELIDEIDKIKDTIISNAFFKKALPNWLKKINEINPNIEHFEINNHAKYILLVIKTKNNNLLEIYFSFDLTIFFPVVINNINNNFMLNQLLVFLTEDKQIDLVIENKEKYDQAKIYLVRAKLSEEEVNAKYILIIGANPDQKDKFNIPSDYKPFYIETSFDGSSSDVSIVKTNYETKSFDEYPLLLCDIRNIAIHFPNTKFDIILCDNGVSRHLDINPQFIKYLLNIKTENGIVILDYIATSTMIIDSTNIFSLLLNAGLSEYSSPFSFPMRHGSILSEAKNLKIDYIEYLKWFNKYLGQSKNIKISNTVTLADFDTKDILLPPLTEEVPKQLNDLIKSHMSDKSDEELLSTEKNLILLSNNNKYLKTNYKNHIYTFII
jgi:hypothetical protein